MEVDELVRRIHAVDDTSTDHPAVLAAIGDVRRLIAWATAREARLARRLAQVTTCAELDLARTTNRTFEAAATVTERGRTAQRAPALEAALEQGTISSEHLDALTRALRRVEPDQQPALAATAERLVPLAEGCTPEDFARRLRQEARRLQADDGTALLERQQRNARTHTWIDRETGMWRLSAHLDPVTGQRIDNQLRAMLDGLLAAPTPPGAPSDPGDRRDWLRAQAFAELCEGKGPRLARPEAVVVIDTRDLDPVTGLPTTTWDLPIEVPPKVLADHLARATVHTIVMDGTTVVHAPGAHDLGRSCRVASAGQRRLLRVLHPTCGVPECRVRFNDCDVHHLTWWRHHGPTDVVNLLPLCARPTTTPCMTAA
jgi:hypothetical protein